MCEDAVDAVGADTSSDDDIDDEYKMIIIQTKQSTNRETIEWNKSRGRKWKVRIIRNIL